jgi:hypothetical protein
MHSRPSRRLEVAMNKNRELCELLGICWHEGTLVIYAREGNVIECSKCRSRDSNPDFTTDAGKVRLLRILRNRDDWHKFAKFCGVDEIQANSLFRIDYILDTTGLLRDKAVEFLKGRKG